MVTGPDWDELQEYLDEDSRSRPLSDWIWGLSRWGQAVLVRAALAIAEPCVDRWHHGCPEDEAWQRHYASSTLPEEALATVRTWLERGAPPGDPELESRALGLDNMIRNAEFHDEELSGGGIERERAAASGRAILMAVETALWTEEHATRGVPDVLERQAIASAGPTKELWDAVRAYRLALPERAEARSRELIRDALRTW